MSQTELLHWCSAYHAAPAPATDEESEIVAQFLAAPYPYQNDDDQDQKQLGDIRASSAYWPDRVTDPSAGACYWPSNTDSSNGDCNAGSGEGYVDDGGCYYYYLGEPDVSLGINTRTTLPCTSIDLNLLGDGDEERTACVQPVPLNPSPADHIRMSHLDGGNDGTAVSRPKRKVPAGRHGGDLGGHKKKEKKASTSSKRAQKCVHEETQSSSSCSGNESICSEADSRRRRQCEDSGKQRFGNRSAEPVCKEKRERINERLKILQKLVPNGTNVDISTMLEEAVQYVRFLQLQIKMLSSDETWMYAPIAYNGMSLGIDLKISPHQ